jgi:diketogulonate reductase-like aldo/keto reductase
MQDGPEVEGAVQAALETGYRSIDTAAAYDNELGVGNGIKASNVPREQLFVTTKVWNSDQGYDRTLKAFDESRRKLGLDTIDLYLIHWPVKGRYKDTWRALEKLYADGVVRAIGVSNFQIHHLEDLLGDCEVKPAVNQVECHPYLTQEALRRFCADNQIQLEAWSPLVEGRALTDATIVDISKRYDKTPAQILIRWDLQHKVVTIPKSRHRHRIVENAQVFDFRLSDEDMAVINSLNRTQRAGPDPDNFNF